MKKTMLRLTKHYDIAIGFEEGSACYYVADCVDADVKLGWIHTDIKKINNNKKLDASAFAKLDSVITVSQNSLQNLNLKSPTTASVLTTVKKNLMNSKRQVNTTKAKLKISKNSGSIRNRKQKISKRHTNSTKLKLKNLRLNSILKQNITKSV